MIIAFLFWTLAILSCAYAFFAGGKDGKWAASVIIAAALATMVGPRTESWIETQLAVSLVDTAALAAMVFITIQSKAYWTIWMTAFHLNAVATHLATLITNGFTAQLYQGLNGFWAIPMLLSMVIGIYLDNRSKRYWHNETPA